MISEYLTYDVSSPTFLRWIKKPNRNIPLGREAGRVNSKGYYQVTCTGKRYENHRVIYFLHHGDCPECVDHIDGNPLNNNIANLRAATLSQNQFNRKLNKNSQSGVKGICWAAHANKWKAEITKNYKVYHVGYFKNLEDAKVELKIFREKLHKEFANHG